MADEAPAAADAPAEEAPASDAPAEAPPAEEGAPPAEEGGAAEEAGAAEEGPPVEAKAPMTEEEAAVKIQARARGMNDRDHVEKDKGYRNPNIGKGGGEGGEAAAEGMSEEELAAQEEARLAAEKAAEEEAERERRKALDIDQCKLQGPALLKSVAGCHSHFFLQCVNGGSDPMNIESERVSVKLEKLATEADTSGEAMEIECEELPLGKFIYNFSPQSSGHYLLTAKVDHQHVPGSPFKLWCVDVWKQTLVPREEESVFPAFMDRMTAPCWLDEHQLVVTTQRNPDPENEHAKVKMEFYSMDRNGDWENWTSYRMSDKPDDQCLWPRRYAGVIGVHEEPAMIMFGGNRDGVKDKDARASDPTPEVLIQEPLLVSFYEGECHTTVPKEIEGPMPSARCGHNMGKVGTTFVLFGGQTADETAEDGSIAALSCDNNTWFMQLKDDGECWHWIKPMIQGQKPTPRHRAGMVIHRKKMFIYGGIGADGQVLNDVYCLEMGAAPKWSRVNCVGNMPKGCIAPTLSILDDPDRAQILAYGGYESTEPGALPSNSLHLLLVDDDHKTAIWEELQVASDDVVRPECITSYNDGVFYNFAASAKPKDKDDPFQLDQINQMMPACVMKPTTPLVPEIVREMGPSCVISWDTDGCAMGDTFVNQYLLEMDFGKHGSPYTQVYTGGETTCRLKDLVPGRMYSFRVRASNGACLSDFSPICTYEATAPPEPDPAAEEAPAEEAQEEILDEEDWYETWLENERLRKEEEKKLRLLEEAERKRQREAHRDYHERLIDMHHIALEKLDEAKDHYAMLHGETCGLLAKRDSTKKADQGQKQGQEHTRPTQKVLQDVSDRLRELEAEEDNREGTREQMQTRLDHKVAAAELVHQRFHNFKKEIASEAENSRSGRKIPEAQLAQIENDEREKDDELKAVRLKNIVLKHDLARLESWLQSKEVLGEGLHLIDFEQLKIENQTLNEKIEERNEELLKLRKKNTTTVQVLTHIKEKLQFVQADNQLQKDNLAKLETDLALRRDELAQHKKTLDQIRHDRYKLKEKSGLVDSDDLLYDFEKTKDHIMDLRETLKGLQNRGKTAQQKTKLVLEEQAALQGDPGATGAIGMGGGAATLGFN